MFEYQWHILEYQWNMLEINGIRWTIDGICLPQGHPKPRPPAAEAEGNIHPARLLDSRCHHFGPRPSTNLRRIGTFGARLKLDFLRSAAEGQLTRDCPELSPNGPVSKIATKAWHKLDAGLTHLRFGRIVWLSTISYYLRQTANGICLNTHQIYIECVCALRLLLLPQLYYYYDTAPLKTVWFYSTWV